jgi:UDP-N-acetylmuramoyl-L-alanyl-D-glutamate--2,6-diaminopimelate ligase
LRFEVVGFTNLTRDHLDDYGSMENYFAAKAQLFTKERANQGVVFLADDYAQKLLEVATIPITTLGESADVNFRYEAGVLKLSGKVEFEIEFAAGELMARNFSLALVMAHRAGYDIQKLSNAPAQYQVPGRLELVSSAKPHVYVDYAHTPDGIAKAVEAISARYQGVTLVFGASGNRDAGKRAEMGRAASAADRVFLTDQHPRDEDPATIRAAVAEGLLGSGKYFVEVSDPAQAIAEAIASTPRDQAVLWCGPGHLKYREIAGQKVAFDARQIAKNLVEK